MVDIQEKFKKLAKRKELEKQAELRRQQKREAHARLIESFMNIEQMRNLAVAKQKYGIDESHILSFTSSFYQKQIEKLGYKAVETLKDEANRYLMILKDEYCGIYPNISWFRFVMNHTR